MTAEPAPWRKPDPVPDPVATTDRLVLRWFRREDANALFRAIDRSRAALLPYMPWATASHHNPMQTRDYIDACTHDRSLVEADNFAIGIFDRESGGFIGGSGYHRIGLETATAEIGYWIDVDQRRKGYCVEATAGLITAGFGEWGFRRIKFCCASVNAGSIAVIERLHLRLEAVERSERWLDGYGWTDQLTYAVLADEWDADQDRGPYGA